MTDSARLPDVSEGRVLGLVSQIYDAALDPDRLPGVLESIAATTKSRMGGVFVQDLTGQHGSFDFTYEFDPDLVLAYSQYYSQENVFMQRAEPDLVSGAVLRGDQYIADDELKKTVYFNDYLAELDAFYNVGCCIFREDTLTAMLTFLRKAGEPAYSDQDMALFAALMPHMQRCLSIQRRMSGLESKVSACHELLDQIDQAVLFLDTRGRPQHFNVLAKQIFDAGDGLSLHPDGLRARSTSDNATLCRLIQEAALTSLGKGLSAGGSMAISRPSMKRPYGVLVSPLPAKPLLAGEPPPSVAILIWDPESTREVPVELLARTYGLTAAEARVTALLLQGLDSRSCAEQLEVSIETVRSHIKRVFSKTDTHSQSDLIRLLLSGPSWLKGCLAELE